MAFTSKSTRVNVIVKVSIRSAIVKSIENNIVEEYYFVIVTVPTNYDLNVKVFKNSFRFYLKKIIDHN